MLPLVGWGAETIKMQGDGGFKLYDVGSHASAITDCWVLELSCWLVGGKFDGSICKMHGRDQGAWFWGGKDGFGCTKFSSAVEYWHKPRLFGCCGRYGPVLMYWVERQFGGTVVEAGFWFCWGFMVNDGLG